MPDDKELDAFLRSVEQDLPPGEKIPDGLRRVLSGNNPQGAGMKDPARKKKSSFSCGVTKKIVNGVTTKTYTMRIGDGPEQVYDTLEDVPEEYREAVRVMTARAEAAASTAPVLRSQPAGRLGLKVGLRAEDSDPADSMAGAYKPSGGPLIYLIAGAIVIGLGALILFVVL